jgi:TRAP-type C4-dicarboxylate transport system substrate-binding protein
MKKLTAMLLALAMAGSLAACSSGDTNDSSNTNTDDANTAAVDSQTPADSSTSDTSSDSDLPFDVNNLGDPVVLTVTCGFSDSEQGSQTLTWVMDQIEELSQGNITFDRYMSGSISTPLEDGSNIASGASDFGSMLEATMTEQLICWQYALNAGSNEQAVGLVQEIFFDNPETSAILHAEAEAAGLKVFAAQVTGHNCVVTREQIDSYKQLAGKTMGAEIGGDTWKLYGMSVQTISVTDEYESLSRGVVDATSAALTAVSSNKWYEVAPYVLVSDGTRASYWIAMNIDTWNSLTADQQALVEYVSKQVTDYSVEYNDTYEQQAIAEMEADGATISQLSAEDQEYNLGLQYVQDYDTYSAIAAQQGKSEQFETVAQAALEYLGFTLDGLRETYADVLG